MNANVNNLTLKSQKFLIIIVAMVLLLIGLLVMFLLLPKNNQINNTLTPTPTIQPAVTTTDLPLSEVKINWMFNGTQWLNVDTVPSCNEPLTIESPVDTDLVTNILYPGQVRGNDFKPHGGFRFDNNINNNVSVTMPMDALLYRGSRYIEAGEVQYLLDFINPCGIMFRFDHLLTLSPRLKSLVEELPAPKVDSTITTNFSQSIKFMIGEEIALAVGFEKNKNVAVDFGMYDLRSPNLISQNSQWAIKYQNEKETAYHGLCWLEYLAGTEMTKVKQLPGSGTEGKISDYCK